MSQSQWVRSRILALVCVAGLLPGVACTRSPGKATPVEPARGGHVDKSATDLLSRQQRQHIWDIEHVAFLIEQKVFPDIKRAITEGERSSIKRLMSDSFAGRVGGEWQEMESEPSYHRRVRKPPEPEGTNATADEFLDFLAGLRNLMDPEAAACSTSIGLVRLGPNDRNNYGGPWQSVWRVRLAGQRESQPVEVTAEFGFSLKSLDDRVAERTGWITAAWLIRAEHIESSQPFMQEATAESGINVEPMYDNWRESEFRSNTGGVYLSDYNSDGMLDLLVDDVRAGVALYRGTGDGRFVDATDEAGVRSPVAPTWALSCWGDFDGDGDEDLITEDRIYENLGTGSFRDVTEESNLLITPATGYTVADYDRDGKLDLYVCHSSAYRIGQEQEKTSAWIDGGTGIDNILWRNLGDWQFDDVTAQTRTGGDGTSCFTGVWFDANRDHRPDLLAINEFGRNSVFMFDEQHVAGETTLDSVFGGFSMGATGGDIDNDGNTDLYVANMYSKAGNRILANVDAAVYPRQLLDKLRAATMGNKLYFSRGDGTFETALAEDSVAGIGWAYGCSLTDFNGDGFLDLYATAGFKSEERGKPDG